MFFEREIEILNIICRSGTSLTSADIIDAGNRLSQSTVQVVLRKLLAQGYIEVAEARYSGNVLSRAYQVTPKVKEAGLTQLSDYTNKMAYIIGADKAEKILDIIMT